MKRTLLIALLFASSAHAATRDDLCIAVGDLGQVIATKREEGASEQALLAITRSDASKADVQIAAASRSIVKYVYTMQVKPDDARKIVYLKCRAGDFGL